MDVIDKAKSQLILGNPFFGTLLLANELVEDRTIPTAATDMKLIYYNPEFFAPLTIKEILFVLAHEVMHIALAHGLRLHGRDHMLWNIACDYAINWMLKEEGFVVLPNALLDARFKDMSADEIYVILHREREEDPRGFAAKHGTEPGGTGNDVMQPNIADRNEAEKLGRKIKQSVAQAANAARMAGKLDGSLQRMIGEILNPKVPWEDELREYMTDQAREDESWLRRNRRFRNVYLPSNYSEKMGPVIFIGDTSGSITNEELCQVGAETVSVAELMNPESIRMVWADTKVAGEQLFEQGDPIDLTPCGGGGTDMRVPLAYVEKYDPVVVILMTDGYTPWPDVDTPYPLIVCCTTDTDVPIGRTIRM